MEELINNEYISAGIHGIIYLANAFVLFFIGKLLYQLFHPSIKVKDELVEKDNLAFALAHTGYFVGLLIVIGSVIIGPSKGWITDVTEISVYGILAILLLNISTIVNDKLLLRHFSVQKEIIDDKNEGTGIVEAANAIASGLIIYGALMGESVSIGHGIMTAVIFWAIGQVILLITSRIYNMMTPYDYHEHIEKDNVAVGVGVAGAIIAMGNIIRFAIMDDFESWVENLTYAGIIIVVGLILLPIVRYLTDKILLPGQNLTDEIVNQEKANIGAATIEAFAYIAGSVLITWCF